MTRFGERRALPLESEGVLARMRRATQGGVWFRSAFIALPLTFGIGVDYAVNVVQRYVREGAGGALTAVRETGGAVILCSLTTMLRYFALARSMNFSVRSLGVATVLGELTCLFAAVLVLPATLAWLDQNRPAGGASIVSLRPPRS